MLILLSFRTITPGEHHDSEWTEAAWGLAAFYKVLSVLTVRACPETWRSPCLWRTGRASQFFPVHLTVLSGKKKKKKKNAKRLSKIWGNKSRRL